MREILDKIVSNDELHKKWLNTLSFMENAGARKISDCEDPLTVDIIQLKHAAEEHRHAYYLKKQITKLGVADCLHYQPSELLAPIETKQYLHNLDIKCSRYLKEQFNLKGKDLRHASYLFVTYAIEVRADLLYPVYQDVLTGHQSRVMVKSIILEEEGHLEEMTAMLGRFNPDWQQYAGYVVAIETRLFGEWINAIAQEVAAYESNTVTMA